MGFYHSGKVTNNIFRRQCVDQTVFEKSPLLYRDRIVLLILGVFVGGFGRHLLGRVSQRNQVSLKLTILLPQFPKSWGYRLETLYPAYKYLSFYKASDSK